MTMAMTALKVVAGSLAMMVVSAAALIRYDARLEGVAPQNAVEQALDEHFDNARMNKVYPKLVHTGR